MPAISAVRWFSVCGHPEQLLVRPSLARAAMAYRGVRQVPYRGRDHADKRIVGWRALVPEAGAQRRARRKIAAQAVHPTAGRRRG